MYQQGQAESREWQKAVNIQSEHQGKIIRSNSSGGAQNGVGSMEHVMQ